jgi:3-phosphoshikimate 1-carboxyvinyltransferase
VRADRLTATPAGPLRGQVKVPGDKSISHRAIILGALASGETRVEGLLESLDVQATIDAVRAFGADAERFGAGSWRVRGKAWRTPERSIDCGNSGTSARLLIGAVAGSPIEAAFTGDESLRSRPMDRVLQPLRGMGAEVTASSGERLPIRIKGGRLHGLKHHSPVASAQVKSALLLAGLAASGDVEITEPAPSRDHTERMLAYFGCEIDFAPGWARLGRDRALTGTHVEVPGDPSSAAFPLVAAAVTPGSRVALRSVLLNPLRAGLLTTLSEMGADIRVERRGGESANIEIFCSGLRGVEVPITRVPTMIDEYPVLAVAAAFASGRTVMRGLSELRVKESDRLSAIVTGLRACGVTSWTEGEDLVVEGCGGPPPGGVDVHAYGDHRIAMSFLVLGLAAERPVSVDSANAIPTSFPDFTDTMCAIGARIS